MKKYSRVEFTTELTDKAFDVYSNSDFVFYKYDDADCYLVADNGVARPFEIGTLDEVEKYLLDMQSEKVTEK